MTTQKDFKKNGYCIVRSAVSKELRDFVTQYALFDEMQDNAVHLGDEQVPAAHSKYADPAMEAMLLHLHPIMEQHTGLKLHPTYSYYRIYGNGDSLAHHMDRPSCEISATVCFNYSYDDAKIQWPIYVNGTPAVLEPGDMVIYRGCDLDHWRDELVAEEDVWHVQGFFHYVDADGPYAKEFKFDGRESIGQALAVKQPVNNAVQKSYITYTK